MGEFKNPLARIVKVKKIIKDAKDLNNSIIYRYRYRYRHRYRYQIMLYIYIYIYIYTHTHTCIYIPQN